ncbi:MAG: PRD domain-containing protein [Streptococcaceae bacterium]|jgi:transcriptional antiterminator|nr:PRD domain-containing protein [Streptococcaceae bacterium]MCH4176895.1 PRD domain-containing protein [Streptococcaceae bacterium]
MKGNQYQDSQKRKIMILKRFLNLEHLSYQQLSDEYFVSRSSIANDITYVKNMLAKEGLNLTFDNSGTYFEGNEFQIRKVMKRVILSYIDDLAAVDILLNRQLFKAVENAFHQAINDKRFEIPESYFQSIVVSIVLIIQRSNKRDGINIKGNNQYGKFFLEFDKYPLVYELLKRLEERDIYHFSPDEVQYLTYIIVGSGLKFFMKSDNIPFSFRGKIRNLIQKVSEGVQIDLTQDSQLEEDLLIHLYQLILRTEAQTTIVNPLIDEIKLNYPSIYGVVWFALNDFYKASGFHFSEDEVGFVTIHFQAAIERIKHLNKILFVCPNGIGTSSFVSAKIRRILPNINSIETVSIEKLKTMDLSDVDFIISTVNISPQARPVVQISPMVSTADMKRIMNYYIDLIIDSESIRDDMQIVSEKTRKFMVNHIYFDNFTSKYDALKFLIQQQKFQDQQLKQKFSRSVFEREALQSTYLDNGFAIPHGNPDFVENTTISILILDKPLKWENQKVDIIILLMIKEEDSKQIESAMKLIMQGIQDKNWFISKMLEVIK